ncbi:MAG: hypothetical protein ACJ73S_08200 [Mycobacteriales bacterium]|jgi:uncharacterized protein YraI
MRRVRLLAFAAATAVAAITAVGLTAGAASASVSGTVHTSGSALTVRSGPSSAYTSWGSVANGGTVAIDCQLNGQSVTGTYGTTTLWDQLTSGGWVSDAYIYTGSDGQVAPTCAYAASPPRANPRGADAAISWEFARLGDTSQEGWCLRFQAQAYGWTAAGFNTAQDMYSWLNSHGYIHTGTPPRGALVWYPNSAGTGHVTVSIGAGKVIGTSVPNKVGVANYNYRTVYGWSIAYFPNAG